MTRQTLSLNNTAPTTPTNTAACTFEALVATVRQYPDDPGAEVHAVNLVSLLAQSPGHRACVALVHARNFNRYEHFERVVFVLADYGVTLQRHWHKSKPAFFLFAELDQPDPAPANSAVRVVEVEPDPVDAERQAEGTSDWQRAA